MNIKVQCSCQTRYSFDVEPVNGQMPIAIACPNCGADGTEFANQFIQQSLATTTSTEPLSSTKPRIRLHAGPAHAEASPAPDSGAEMHRGAEMCSRHVRNVATEHCVVCQKPICPECMQAFGYLCSIGCRYRAEQERIRVPVYKLQRNQVERGQSRKTVALAGAGALVVLALFAALFWYTSTGSKPRPYYTYKLPQSKEGVYAQFLGPDQILLLRKGTISAHNIKTKEDAWSTALDDPAPATAINSANLKKSSGADDYELFSGSYYSSEPAPFFSGDTVWICRDHHVFCIDLKTGAQKFNVPFRGRRSSFTTTESTALVVSEASPTRKILTLINLVSGEVKTSEVAVAPRERVPQSKELPSNVLPTAAMLMKNELDPSKASERAIYKSSSEFFPAGQNLTEMRVKLVEIKLTSVETMKKAGPSKLNSDTSASTSARAVAEEIFNELKKSNTGGVRTVDESRYGVTLHREMETGAVDWTGEVVGVPYFFPMKTVDLLVSGKSLLIFDKQNKKLAEAKLTFPIAEKFTSGYSRNTAPGLEANGMLLFYDQGVLTAFELPTGSVRWRLPSVGIKSIQQDKKGMLYISTTTAIPEDIQYVDQIKMADSIQPLVMKVDLSGKILWKSAQTCEDVYITGKYIYVTDSTRGGFAMITAAEEAFGRGSRGDGALRMYRLDPSNGKKMWAYTKAGYPYAVDFSENRILLHYAKEIEIMKFISF